MSNYDLFISHAWDYDERYVADPNLRGLPRLSTLPSISGGCRWWRDEVEAWVPIEGVHATAQSYPGVCFVGFEVSPGRKGL